MKTDNIFDVVACDMNGIDEDSVCEENSVSSETVKKLVFDRIANEAKTAVKKKNRKNKIIILIAAVVTAIAVLSTVAAATGAFTTIFGKNIESFIEEPLLTYADITSDSDTVDIVCNGITGDDYCVFAAFTITKKDGTSFVDNIQGQEIFSHFTDYNGNRLKRYIGCTHIGLDGNVNGINLGEIKYTFEDEKTITAFLSFMRDEYYVNGQTVRIVDSKVFAEKKKEVIYRMKLSRMADGRYFYNYSFNEPFMEQTRAKYESELKENEFIKFDMENNELCIYTRTEIPLNYSLSFTVDYPSENITLADEPYPIVIEGIKYNVTKLTAHSYGFDLDIECPDYETEQESFYAFNPASSVDYEIELTDGRIVKGQVLSGGNVFDEELGYSVDDKFHVTGLFGDYDKDGYHISCLDPNEIRSISLYGEKIYRRK